MECITAGGSSAFAVFLAMFWEDFAVFQSFNLVCFQVTHVDEFQTSIGLKLE